MAKNDEVERLSLPSPVDQLWAGTWPCVERLRRRLETNEERWAFGGGSVLAGRWKHRRSTDVDLITTAEWPMERIGAVGRNHLTDTMEPLGGTLGLWNNRFVQIEFNEGGWRS